MTARISAAHNQMVPPVVQSCTGVTTFDELYHKYNHRVRTICWKFSKSQAQSEDLMQETWLRCLRFLKDFRGDSAFETWLHRLTFRVCLTDYRDARQILKLEAFSYDQPMPEQLEQESEVYFEPVQQDLQLLSAPDRLMLSKLFEDLSEDDRKILVMLYKGCQISEMAQILNCKEGACKSKIMRARARMHDWYCRHCMKRQPSQELSMEEIVKANLDKPGTEIRQELYKAGYRVGFRRAHILRNKLKREA